MNKRQRNVLVTLGIIIFGFFSFSMGQRSITRVLDSEMEVIKKADKIIEKIDRNYLYEYDEEKLKDGVYKGLVAGLGDDYSVYYNAEEYKALMEHTDGVFGGVGIEINGGEGDRIQVVAPIKSSPAEKAGIQSGDKIIAIDGVEYTSEQIDEAVKKMRGEPGEAVKLTIQRLVEGQIENIDIELIREEISSQSIHAQILDEDIGYIHITGFQRNTYSQFMEEYDRLKKDGAKKLVLDLRNNPGGLLDVTEQLANEFISDGTIVSIKEKNNKEEIIKADSESDNIPMVVLINKGSASASEILSAALKENNRADLVGTTSFGKGVVQNIISFDDERPETGIKLTIAEFFTPEGNQIHKKGVSPNYEVEIDEDVRIIGPENLKEDRQLQKAIELLK